MVHVGIDPKAFERLRGVKSIEELRAAVANGLPCINVETGQVLGYMKADTVMAMFEKALNGGAC